MKQQVIFIHGGGTYATYEGYLTDLRNRVVDVERSKKKKWRKDLAEKLEPDFDIFLPEMPNGMNAKYVEWKIWFDKFIPYINDGVILAGHSLGAIFLAKYCAENSFPKKIKALFLIAPPYDAEGTPYSLADFILPASLAKVEEQCKQIFIYQSKDDPIVPFDNLAKYTKALPTTHAVIFEDKHHFIHQPEFPELIKHIRQISSQ